MCYDFIFIGAHPDDIILMCSGMIASITNKGFNSLIVSLTDGSYKNTKKAEIRKKELEASARILGVDYQILGLQDTELREDMGSTQKAFEIIDTYQPTFVVTHHEKDLHPDHVNGNRIVKRAVHQYFVRGCANRKKLKGILYFPPVRITNNNYNSFSTNFIVNISRYINIKRKVIKQHQSQFPHILRHMEIIISLNRLLGSINGVEFVEGFFYENFMPMKFAFNEICELKDGDLDYYSRRGIEEI